MEWIPAYISIGIFAGIGFTIIHIATYRVSREWRAITGANYAAANPGSGGFENDGGDGGEDSPGGGGTDSPAALSANDSGNYGGTRFPVRLHHGVKTPGNIAAESVLGSTR